MEHLTEAVIISGFSSWLSGYELHNHFRSVSQSRDYIFLYAVINASQSAAKYFRYEHAEKDNIVLNIDIGTREEHCKFLLQLGAMKGIVSNKTLHREKERFLNIIGAYRGIHLHDSFEHSINSRSRPASRPFST